MIFFNQPGTIKLAVHCKWRFKCKSYTIFQYYSYTYKLTCKLLVVLHGNLARFKNIINLKKFLLLTLLHSSVNPDLVLCLTALGYTRCSKASKQKLLCDLSGWRMVPRKTWVSENFGRISILISLEVSFLHGLFLLFLSLETFYQGVSGSDF